nr:YxeA family protein [uncultured Enterococcus sp.]
MKKAISMILLVLTIGTVTLVTWSYFTKDDSGELVQLVDRFNPFVPEKKVYVKTSDEYGVPQEHDAYEYTQEGINEDGQKIKITFWAPQKLKENAYLELDAKGKHVESYQEVTEQDLPDAVKDELVTTH